MGRDLYSFGKCDFGIDIFQWPEFVTAKIMDAMENVGTDLLQTTSSCTQDLVAYRYNDSTRFLEHTNTIGINAKNRHEVQCLKNLKVFLTLTKLLQVGPNPRSDIGEIWQIIAQCQCSFGDLATLMICKNNLTTVWMFYVSMERKLTFHHCFLGMQIWTRGRWSHRRGHVNNRLCFCNCVDSHQAPQSCVSK